MWTANDWRNLNDTCRGGDVRVHIDFGKYRLSVITAILISVVVLAKMVISFISRHAIDDNGCAGLMDEKAKWIRKKESNASTLSIWTIAGIFIYRCSFLWGGCASVVKQSPSLSLSQFLRCRKHGTSHNLPKCGCSNKNLCLTALKPHMLLSFHIIYRHVVIIFCSLCCCFTEGGGKKCRKKLKWLSKDPNIMLK